MKRLLFVLIIVSPCVPLCGMSPLRQNLQKKSISLTRYLSVDPFYSPFNYSNKLHKACWSLLSFYKREDKSSMQDFCGMIKRIIKKTKLIHGRVQPNLLDGRGFAPLHIIMMRGLFETKNGKDKAPHKEVAKCIDALAQAGADINQLITPVGLVPPQLVTREGLTPLDLDRLFQSSTGSNVFCRKDIDAVICDLTSGKYKPKSLVHAVHSQKFKNIETEVHDKIPCAKCFGKCDPRLYDDTCRARSQLYGQKTSQLRKQVLPDCIDVSEWDEGVLFDIWIRRESERERS